jgi:hypothetical protein
MGVLEAQYSTGNARHPGPSTPPAASLWINSGRDLGANLP